MNPFPVAHGWCVLATALSHGDVGLSDFPLARSMFYAGAACVFHLWRDALGADPVYGFELLRAIRADLHDTASEQQAALEGRL